MSRRAIASCLVVALSLLASGPALAAIEDDDEPQDEGSAGPWSLSIATQVARLSARGVNAELGYDVARDTTVRVAGESVDYSSTAVGTQRSLGLELGASHDFGILDVDVALGRWQNTDVVTAKEFKLGYTADLEPWSAGFRLGYRRSDFDPFATTVRLVGTPNPVIAIARCHLDNTALGADGRYQGDVWGAYATAMRYNYQNPDCTFDVIGFRRIRSRQPVGGFRQLAAQQLARLTTVATRRIGRQETLLDSSLDVGVSWKHADLTVSLDGSRERDFFIGATATIVSVTATADLGLGTSVDVTLGDSRGAIGTAPNALFVGFAVRTRF